jgi:hypothetical protein
MSPGKMVDLGAAKLGSGGKPPVSGGIKILSKGDSPKSISNGSTAVKTVKLVSKGTKPLVPPKPPTKAEIEAAEKAAEQLKRLSIGEHFSLGG